MCGPLTPIALLSSANGTSRLWLNQLSRPALLFFGGIMSIKNVLAGVAVRDVQDAIRWYKMLLGREPDTQPMEGLVEWQFDGGGWLQVNENKMLSGRSFVTFVESDFESRLRTLKKSGIEPKSITRGENVSVIIITDPDGNQIVFAQGKGENHRAVS